MLTCEQRIFLKKRRATLYQPEQLEVRLFSGDVYTRLIVAPRVLACDPDGNERVTVWPKRGVTLGEAEASDSAINTTLRKRRHHAHAS